MEHKDDAFQKFKAAQGLAHVQVFIFAHVFTAEIRFELISSHIKSTNLKKMVTCCNSATFHNQCKASVFQRCFVQDTSGHLQLIRVKCTSLKT